jgi:hypothetical protein
VAPTSRPLEAGVDSKGVAEADSAVRVASAPGPGAMWFVNSSAASCVEVKGKGLSRRRRGSVEDAAAGDRFPS